MRSTGKAPEAYYFYLPTKNKTNSVEIKRIANIAISMIKKSKKLDLELLSICLNSLLILTADKYNKLENL